MRPRAGCKAQRSAEFFGVQWLPRLEYTMGFANNQRLSREVCLVPNAARLAAQKRAVWAFVGCNYPDCDFIAEDPTQREQDSVPCPECEKAGRKGRVVAKTGRSGKQFFSCDQFPTCDFSLPLPPVKEACPECDFPLLMRKRSQGSERLVCPQKHCDYRSKPL